MAPSPEAGRVAERSEAGRVSESGDPDYGRLRYGNPHPSGRDDVGIRKPIALHRLADRHIDPPRKHRPGDHEGMKLAVLAARVDARRQLGEQRVVEAAAREGLRQLA